VVSLRQNRRCSRHHSRLVFLLHNRVVSQARCLQENQHPSHRHCLQLNRSVYLPLNRHRNLSVCQAHSRRHNHLRVHPLNLRQYHPCNHPINHHHNLHLSQRVFPPVSLRQNRRCSHHRNHPHNLLIFLRLNHQDYQHPNHHVSLQLFLPSNLQEFLHYNLVPNLHRYLHVSHQHNRPINLRVNH